MVLSAAKTSRRGGEGWGMGFLLIFFPDDDSTSLHPNKKKTSFSLSSSSSSSSSRPTTAFHLLLSKTQYTLLICALLVFTTLLFFTLSTFEPTLPRQRHHFPTSRRQLFLKSAATTSPKQRPSKVNPDPSISLPKLSRIFTNRSKSGGGDGDRNRSGAAALQGMGTLYRRGTKAMSELIVGHVSEDAGERELRSFLRILHYNGLLAKSDLVLIFSNSASSSLLSSVVEEESESYLKLVQLYGELNETGRGSAGDSGLNLYLRIGKEEEKKESKREEQEKMKEAIWGKGTRVTTRINYSNAGELKTMSYGSVVGFDASELDPESSLSGFMDHVPLSLRRWGCYPMLLGRVKRNFKRIMLVDVKNLLVLKDPFIRVRNRSPKSLLLFSDCGEPRRRGKSNSAKTRDHHDTKPLNPGLIIGGDRGVRRFANAMLMEIVRATSDHKGKRKNSANESGIVNQLVRNSYVMKNVNFIPSPESIHEASSFAEFNSSESGSYLLSLNYAVLKRGGRNFDVDLMVRREMCSFEIYSFVYSDCVAIQ